MSGAKILVVDDDEAMLLLVRALLESEGYSVSTAKDGAMAVMIAQRNVPDLIVVDIGLPGGDGLLVLRRLRAINSFRETPVIVLTGKDGSDWRRKAEEVGASHFMTKPIERDTLLSQVRRHLPPTQAPAQIVRCPQCGHTFDPFSHEGESSASAG